MFAKLWGHSAGHSHEAVITCILVSYKVDEKAAEDLLVLVKGDVPVVTDYSRSGEKFTWRISRLKLWNDSLKHLIDFNQSTMSSTECYRRCLQHKVIKLGRVPPLEDTITQIDPYVVKNCIEYSTGEMIIRLAIPFSGEPTSAVFLLFTDVDLVDSFTGLFHELQVRYFT